MRKLRLDLDAIQVDTFDTAAVEKPRGTVQAHACCCNPCCCTCCHTCGNSCGGTCLDTCYQTCDSCWYTCPGGYECGPTNEGDPTCDYRSTDVWMFCACCPM